jgi:hypothetical protein
MFINAVIIDFDLFLIVVNGFLQFKGFSFQFLILFSDFFVLSIMPNQMSQNDLIRLILTVTIVQLTTDVIDLLS